MAKDEIQITPETTIEAILEDVPGGKDVLVKHFGAGVTMPGQTWTTEPLSRACTIRGVDTAKLLKALQKLSSGA